MGLFDRFRKPKPSVPLAQLCYDMAYFILPQYVYGDPGKIVDLCSNQPSLAGPFFYVMACTMSKVEPSIEDAKRFRWHRGRSGDGRDYFVLEYPTPPPFDLVDMVPGDSKDAGHLPVLAPHFSGMIGAVGSGEFAYYILGQSPMGGGTTLRSVLREGVNCNLGPGPRPELAGFLEAISGGSRDAP